MRLLLWRHGRTAWNHLGRFQGQLDPPLDEVGHAQARAATPVLAARRPAVIVASDLERARSTAAVLGALVGVPVRPDERLREIELGEWSGLTLAEAVARFPDEHDRWQRGEDVRRGGGETYTEVAARALTVVEEVRSSLSSLPEPDRVAVLVTHGGTARAVAGRLLELPPQTWWRLGPLGNCRWATLREYDRGWRLVEHGNGVLGGPVLDGPAPEAPPEPVHSMFDDR